ncbi:hypothetical protein B0H17DRAFT_220260 [Mycena rosella]|uniref:Uncharacterized protein n=1 Tax=Mycena rosella TaxID=1033263 RepID=A0AAD7CXN0_MYCRO|nr:hypothetical protein B0H17DRAFT_220260 [Mycena rosella]
MTSLYMYSSGSGPLPSDTSAGSLDLSHYALDDSLLSESLTLSSLSSSTSSTPPIPAGCMVPLSTIIGHHEGPTMFRRASSRRVSKATLTSPTPPRLRTMLREKLLVESWLHSVDSDQSDHTPWAGIDNVKAIPWKSEGSIHTPAAFKTKMAFARRNRSAESKEQDSTPSIFVTAPAGICQRTANRNALVFEREIILDSGGTSRRLSLRASAETMDPEVAEMISELQNLSSFFKKQESSSSDHAVAPPQPPSLIVSNSHFSLPVSLESSGNLKPGVPVALAARRGKKMLPPLSFKPASDEDAYPSMPSAFLGSPSAYSPKFEFASDPNRRSMDLQQMVTSLRSQCASIDSGAPFAAADSVTALPTAANGEDDEWAFADGLLGLYNSHPFDSDFVKKPLLPHMVDYAEESLADDPLYTRPISVLNAPPSTPLPPCPASQRASVRSILKSSKSVRFASLPNERPVSIAVPAIRAPRRSLGPSISPRKPPVPLRPRSHTTVRPTIPAPLRSPPPKPTATPGRSPGQRRATTPAASCRLTSPASSPVRPCASTMGSPPKSAASSGRNSLSRVFSNATAPKEKENNAGSPNPPTPSRTRWTLNENVLRRASISEPLTQKSRMPVPLRNILTRFK